MKIKVLNRDTQSLKAQLHGKRRIMTYGAGIWANDIKKMLEEYGYALSCAIVDDEYYDKIKGGGETDVVSIEKLNPPYEPQLDVIIWAIASPEKLRYCMENRQESVEAILIWDMMGFWKDKSFFSVHKQEFQEASELLYDEYSKNVFWAYIEAQKGNVDDDIFYCTKGTYFNELTKEKREGAFLDCGSYDGESAIAYMKFIGEECQVYAFEPDKENYQNLAIKMKDRENFVCINKGCYSVEKQLSFTSNGDMSSSLQENGSDVVEVTTIDKVVGNEKVAFIKMDVEGAELEALKGARTVIERDMPILAVSAYHKQEDLITLIPYIHSLCNEKERYQLYLRHHGVVQTELVLYAIPVAYLES